MKLLPQDKKKTLLLAIIVALCLGGIVYFIFFYGSQPAEPEPFSAPLGDASRISEIMPYGSTFNTKVLEQEKFKALRPAPKIEVLPEDLGNPDLFTR